MLLVHTFNIGVHM